MANYRYLGYGITDENGIATLDHDANGNPIDHSYTGTGAGELDIIASLDDNEHISDSSLQSETFGVLDCKFIDSGLNDGTANDNLYAFRCKYTRQSDGTLIEVTHQTADAYLMIDETGDTKPFTGDLCFECDIVSSNADSNNLNGLSVSGNTNQGINFPNTTTGYHVKFTVTSTGISMQIDDGTPTTKSPVTGNYDIRFVIRNGKTIKYRNAKLYPI